MIYVAVRMYIYDTRAEKASHRLRLNIPFNSLLYSPPPTIYIDYMARLVHIRVQLTRARTRGQKSRVR